MRRTLACRDCDATYEIEVVRGGRKKPYCDACTERRRREAKARYREKNRETIRAKGREYARARYAADPERFREKQRERAAADPDGIRVIARRSYLKNADKRRAEARARRQETGPEERRAKYLADPERHRGYARQYRKRNPEKVREALRRWLAEHPEKDIEYKHRRRARVARAAGSFTHAEFVQRCAEHNDRCFYCGTAAPLCVEHVTPLSRGGSNHIDNIVGACRSCNSSKHNLTLHEYVSRRWKPSHA